MSRVLVSVTKDAVTILPSEPVKVDVNYIVHSRSYEATKVGAGRPMKQTKDRVTKRLVGTGATRDEAVAALFALIKAQPRKAQARKPKAEVAA